MAIQPDSKFHLTSILIDSKENTATSHPAFIDITLADIGPKGDTGATGLQGPKGDTGATGPAVTTSSVCSDGGSCSCTNKTISKVTAGATGVGNNQFNSGASGSCNVTSDTGSCTGNASPATGYYVDSFQLYEA